jgi:hypothetical protein
MNRSIKDDPLWFTSLPMMVPQVAVFSAFVRHEPFQRSPPSGVLSPQDSQYLLKLTSRSEGIPELWFQAADKWVVCSLTEALFDVNFHFENGRQISSINTIVKTNGGFEFSGLTYAEYVKYAQGRVFGMAKTGIFNAVANVLVGNVTVSPSRDGEFSIYESSSKVLQTALIGCDEIQHGIWKPDTALQSANISEVIGGEPWMCRNKTLSRAVEDLINNMTLSLLSDPRFLYVALRSL